MSDHIEVIDLTDTLRVVVDQDPDAENPRTLDETEVGFVNVTNWWGRDDYIDTPEGPGDPTGRLTEAHDRLWASFYVTGSRRWGGATCGEQHVLRWARIFHGLHLEYEDGVDMHAGYWIGSPNAIRAEREAYSQWAEGQVFVVTVQTRAEYVRVDETMPQGVEPFRWDDRITTWENGDSIGGCYLDPDYTALDVARENFGIDITPANR